MKSGSFGRKLICNSFQPKVYLLANKQPVELLSADVILGSTGGTWGKTHHSSQHVLCHLQPVEVVSRYACRVAVQ